LETIREPDVRLIAITEFRNPQDVPWNADPSLAPDDPQHLIEYSGRNCYLSWQNLGGKTNEQYIGHILEVGHLSVIEHASASFSLSSVSRSLTHELIRHRHLSFSQQSQRYVDEAEAGFVEPDAIAANPELHQLFADACGQARQAYVKLVEGLRKHYDTVEDKTLRRKLARQAARSVLPNATATRIVVSGNFRAWRWFLHMRGSEHADVEIRAVAVEIYKHLVREAPAVFADFQLRPLPDGTEAVESKYPY
jgi:thymidylate synthase (FAD)